MSDIADPFHHPFRWTVLAGVWLAYYCFGLISVLLAPVVNTVAVDLGLDRAQMGTVLGGWQLVYIATAVPCGIVLDRIGPRRAIAAAVLIIAVSGGLRACAQGFVSLLLAVGVFGLGGPLISIGAPKLISLWFEGKERAFAMGVYITGPVLGAVIVLSLSNSIVLPLVGGDWRSVMLVFAAAVLAAALVWWAITSHPLARAVEGRLAAEPRESQLRAFASLLRIPAVCILLVMSIGIFFYNHGLNNWLPEILRSGGMSASAAGFWSSVPALVGILSALVVPRLATPRRRLHVLFFLIVSGGIATLFLHGVSEWPLAFGFLAQGIARGGLMTVAVLTLIEIREIGPRRAGLAGGMFFAAAEVGGVLGPVSIGLVAELTGSYDASLWMLTTVCAILAVLVGFLRFLTRRGAASPAAPAK
jgi:CP family cyanate transporter-like MFS transporter